jgi:hypothetical protein
MRSLSDARSHVGYQSRLSAVPEDDGGNRLSSARPLSTLSDGTVIERACVCVGMFDHERVAG